MAPPPPALAKKLTLAIESQKPLKHILVCDIRLVRARPILPRAHAAQVDIPSWSLYCPYRQTLHDCRPSTSWYVPVAQTLHALAASLVGRAAWYWPTAQGWQLPAAQFRQLLAEFCPAWSPYLPEAQRVHTLAASFTWGAR